MTPTAELPASLNDWLALLAQRHPREIDLGLDRVAAVAARLQLGRPAPKVIVVGGTNGKGSCVATLQALLLAAGRRVGCYTSPHLIRYNERICINGAFAGDAEICAAFARIEQARGDISLTCFEFGTLAALLLMAAAPLDVAVLEVGLGGRLDAVNIVAADVAVITSIQLDHEAWLGDTRDAIGREKAGIARAGMPLVCGDPQPPPALVAALAELGAVGHYLGVQSGGDFGFAAGGEGACSVYCQNPAGDKLTFADLPQPRLPLPSVACAVQALVLLGEPVTADVLRAVLAELRLAGRFQHLLWRGRRVILDVAHNPAAAELLARRLAEHLAESPCARVLAVFAVLADKDIDGMVAPLAPLVSRWYLSGLADVARAAGAEELAGVLYNRGADLCCCADVEAGFWRAHGDLASDDMLLVFGSFYTVGRVLACLGEEGGIQ